MYLCCADDTGYFISGMLNLTLTLTLTLIGRHRLRHQQNAVEH